MKHFIIPLLMAIFFASCTATRKPVTPQPVFTVHLSYVSTLISYHKIDKAPKGTYAFIYKNKKGVVDSIQRTIIYKNKRMFEIGSKYMLYLDTVLHQASSKLIY